MATITGQKLSELNKLNLGGTGTKFYAVSSNNNSFFITEIDLYQTLYNLHLSGAFQPKTEDWRVVHKTGAESITGNKSFVQNTTFSSFLASGAKIHLLSGVNIILAGNSNISGANINLAGFDNTSPCFGNDAAKLNLAGSNGLNNSVIIGNSAAKYSNASDIICIGANAGGSDVSAASNVSNALAATNSVLIGSSAGIYANNATDTVFIGYQAGADSTSAANSIFIGSSAGYAMANASESIFLGNNAGTNRAKTLWIDTTSAANPLIYGEFDTRKLKFYGNVEGTGYVSGSLIKPGTDGILFNNNMRLYSSDATHLKLEDANGPTEILSYNLSDEILTIIESCTVGEVLHVNNYSNLMGNTRIEKLIISGTAPSTPTSVGISGQVGLSGQKLFVCTGTNKWGYINITPW